MKVIQIEKPIRGKETKIKQEFDQMLKELLPIHYWISKNKK